MKKFYKKTSLILTIFLVLNTNNTVFGAATDIQKHWAENIIQKGLESGYLYQYDDKSFKPDQPITRAEFLKTLNSLLGLRNKKDINFVDVTKSNKYYGEIQKTVSAGYMTGKSTESFDPDGLMTREEMAAIIANVVPPIKEEDKKALNLFDDNDDISTWAKNGVETAVFRGYVTGKPGNIFDPKGNLTRAEAAILVNKISERETIIKNEIILENKEDIQKLKNSIISGNIILSDKVRQEILIQDCVMLGNFLINGGKDKITIEQSIISNLTVDNSKNSIVIVASGETKLNNVILRTDAELKIDKTNKTKDDIYKQVIVEKQAKPDKTTKPSSSTSESSSGSSSNSSNYDYSDNNSNNNSNNNDNNNNYIPQPPITNVTLSPPSGFAVKDDSTVSEKVYNLVWNTVPNASGYSIVIKSSDNEYAIDKSGNNINSLSLTNILVPNINYTLKIKALGQGIYKDSSYSQIDYTIIIDNYVPQPPEELTTPSELRVENVSANKYNVLWNIVPNSIGYEIIIDNKQTIKINDNNLNTYDITKYITIPGATHSIKIKAIGAGKFKDSQFSEISYDVPKLTLLAPTNVKMQEYTSGYKIIWNTVLNSTGYEIVINDESTIISSATTNSYEIPNFDFNKEYIIKIKAIGSDQYEDSQYFEMPPFTASRINLPAPLALKVNNNSGIYLFTWNMVTNCSGYEIVINNEPAINIDNNTTSSYDISSYLTEHNKEYMIKIKALGTGKYNNSTYSEVKYITPPDLPSGNLEAPAITDIKFIDFVSKKGFIGETSDVIVKDLALTLLWSHSGADSFEITITEGSNIKTINVSGTQNQLRLNQHLTKANTKYDISIKAIKSSEKSDASIVKSYTTPNGCGHNNGFVFLKENSIPWGGINFIEGLYTVATPQQLEHVSQHGGTPAGSSATFFLMNDIDFGGKTYSSPIITGSLYMSFDGQGRILNNFTINSNDYSVGVFQQTYQTSPIKDTIIGENVTISGGSNTLYIGGLIGYSYKELIRCENYATINAQTSDNGNLSGVGGLAGYSAGTISDSKNYGNITNTGNGPTGGMTGRLGFSANVVRSTNTGTITAPNKGDLYGSKQP